MNFSFGIFDSFDQGDSDPGKVLHDRLDFAVAAEQRGMNHYHVTEHHGTPLSVCPSPNIFLAALAGRTSIMRMGALVYVLPTYHPLRLAEEIAALDQLTNGRLDIGIGGGVSPYELSFFDVPIEERMKRYVNTSETLLKTLKSGRYALPLSEELVQLSILPVQQPYPPIWYATSNANSAEWAGSNSVNLVGRWNSGQFAEVADVYWNAQQEISNGSTSVSGSALPLRIGPAATVVVGETDAEAHDLFISAGTQFTNDLLKLWHEHDNDMLDDSYNLTSMIDKGNAIIGSVESVTESILHQVESASINYFEATLMFGSMTLEQGRQNLDRFAEVMSRVREAYPSVAENRVPMK